MSKKIQELLDEKFMFQHCFLILEFDACVRILRETTGCPIKPSENYMTLYCFEKQLRQMKGFCYCCSNAPSIRGSPYLQCAQNVWVRNRHPCYQKSPQIATLIYFSNSPHFCKKSLLLCQRMTPLSFLLHFYATIFWKI